ncbi:Uncharacterized protein FWK35_00012778 [Aphis craccivora]|uniref:Reverse transcriptase domain-containing protein n=1 Tax=Aphis craccivora TaxID=307492 RepID=A0A6G0Y6B8_APHCR|nr:Uncharacterized protein FWK35_00012778 [Aphis craccivora]
MLHTKIKVEEPYKPEIISQCLNCQEYGHTKSYCNYSSRCVRCGDHHQSSNCTISRDTPPKCVLCQGNHPASYRECSVYKEIQRRKKPSPNNAFLSDNSRFKKYNVQTNHPENDTPPNNARTYTQATSGQQTTHPSPSSQSNINNAMTLFLEEFKSMINPLIALLTKVISSLHKANHPDNTAHGGAAIFVKYSISYQSLPSVCEDIFQSCAIQINANNVPITVAAIYSPPKHNVSYENFSNYFNTINNNFIIGNNAKHQSWGCRVNKTRRNVLFNFVNARKFKVLAPPVPTYWPSSAYKNPDILDIFITKTPSNVHYVIDNILDLNSDHSLKSIDDIDAAVNNQTNVIQSAAWASNTGNHLKKVLAKIKNLNYENFLSKLSTNNGRLWKASKQALHFKITTPPIKKSDGNILPVNSDTILSGLDISASQSFPIKHFSPSDIKFAIQKHTLRKSPGYDLITAEIARCLPKRAIAFNRVWHEGLLYKVKTCLPPTYYTLLKSYLTDRYFQVLFKSAYSNIANIRAGVSQGGILSSLLYNLYASDQPTSDNTIVADYADDKIIISINQNPIVVSLNLQNHLSLMETRYNNWRIKVNQTKSNHTTFTLNLGHCPPVTLYGTQIPSTSTVKYLGLTLDRRLTLATHSNPLVKTLSSIVIPGNPPRRLKRNWCRDMLT